MLLHDLQSRGLIDPPYFLADNCQYLCIMGSIAYGVATDFSDNDTYGFAIPPKNILFPSLSGEIEGFDKPVPRWKVFDPHGIQDKDSGKSYDFAIYNIAHYFSLCLNGIKQF